MPNLQWGKLNYFWIGLINYQIATNSWEKELSIKCKRDILSMKIWSKNLLCNFIRKRLDEVININLTDINELAD